jgi:hypothetical protein
MDLLVAAVPERDIVPPNHSNKKGNTGLHCKSVCNNKELLCFWYSVIKVFVERDF